MAEQLTLSNQLIGLLYDVVCYLFVAHREHLATHCRELLIAMSEKGPEINKLKVGNQNRNNDCNTESLSVMATICYSQVE